MHEIAPLYCGLEPLQEQDPLRKAEMILKNTEKIGCRQFLQPQDIVNVSRLTLDNINMIYNNLICREMRN